MRQCDLRYQISHKTTSDCYAALLPLLNSREAELPLHQKALFQIGALQRRPSASGKDKIMHSTNAHDDMAAAITVAVAHCAFGTAKVTWSIATGISQWSSDGHSMSSSDSYWENMRRAYVSDGNRRHDGRTYDEVRIPEPELPPFPRIIIETNAETLMREVVITWP
ncbi:MAG: hypothetical protein ACLP0B_02680 [Steroidobacteraceae bacterium]